MPFRYWEPGREERKIRVFISHRYDQDAELYDELLKVLASQGHPIQDISLNSSQSIVGARGGVVADTKIQANIAARIYTSDILIAPSRPGITRSEWVSWEVRLASVGYGVPILFVDFPGQQNRAQVVSDIEDLKLPFAICEPETRRIIPKFMQLIGDRPTWGVRWREESASLKFRGPPALSEIEITHPFESRFAGS